MAGTSPVSEAAAQDLGPTMVEEGVAPTAAAEVARPVAGRRLVRTVLAAATVLLFGSAALAASLHHACGLGLRVDGVHVSAPEGADSADLMLDAGLVRPDWSPHRAWLRSATCQLRMRDLDVAVEAPDAQHQGPSRVKLHARTRVSPAGAAASATSGCEVTSSVELFGLGLRVPWTAWLPVDLSGAKAPTMWMQRSGSVTRKGSWSLQSPNVTLEQPALVGWRVPAGSFPEALDGLLGRASISLDAAVAYEESGDRSVRLTQAVNASLVIESDGEGGYLVSAPAFVTGHVRPAAFAAALGKLLVGDSRGERGGVHRSVRMAAVAPSSLAAQYLGASHAVGWRSRRASAVHDLARGARRLLGRRLARSLGGSAGERLVQQPPRDGRRLTGESTTVTFSEMMYADGSEIDIELNATITDNAIDFDLQYGMDEATQFEVHLSAADSAEAGEASLDLAVVISDVEVAKVEFSSTDSTDETTFSVLIKAPDSGDTIASVSATSSASAGESLSARVYNPEDGTEFITVTGTNSSASMSFSAVVKDPSDSSSTLLDASAGATYTGADTEDGTLEATVSVGGEQIVLSGTLADSYRTQGGFTMDASLSVAGSTTGRIDVDGTHDDTGLTVVALVEVPSDGSYQQILKLDPLILVTKSTNYTVHATVHDSSDTEMGTAGVSLTNEPTSGQAQDVDINLFSPMDSSLNATMSVSLASGLLDMLTDAAEIPCLQGSCSLDVGLQSQHMDLVFSSMTSDDQEDYRAVLGMTARDTLYYAGASVTVQSVNMIAADIQLGDGNSAIAIDQFAMSSTGTIKDENNAKIIGWDLSADVSSSSQSVDLTVDSGSSPILEVDISFTELLARNSSAGEIKLEGERLVKWDVVSATSGTATTLDMDVWDPDGQLLTIDASLTEDASAGSEVLLGSAAVRMESGQAPEAIGGVRLETVDAAGDRATFQLQVLTSDLSTPFFQLDAGVDFTAASGVRLLTDWDASVEAHVWDPSDTDAGVMMTMSVTGSSSGGVFTSGMAMEDNEGNQLMNWSMVGTSSSDSITTHGNIDGVMGVALTLTKPDGRLDTMTEMALTLTMDSLMDDEDDNEMEVTTTQQWGEDDSDLMDMESVSISLSLGYDGADTWDVTGSLIQNGDTYVSVEAHLHEEWVSVTSWANEEIGDLMGAGFMYEYVNASIPTSDSSDMWEISYVQTSDFIETTNLTWHTDDSAGESSFSVKSYAMELDGGVWRYILSVNASADMTGGPTESPTPAPPAATLVVSGSFRASVAASEAEDFISNSDVVDSFVTSIAARVGMPESTVAVTLSVYSGRRLASRGGRRMTAEAAEILVSYTITAQVGSSGGGGVISQSAFDSIVDTLESTTADNFVADFNTQLQGTGSASTFSAVAAVPNSETAPTTTDQTPRSVNSGAYAAFPQALLLATVCRLLF